MFKAQPASGAPKVSGNITKQNNCFFVPPDRWSTELIMRYLLPEEKPLIFFKSQKDEFLFTSYGLIFADATENANSPKRTVTRTNWAEADLGNVSLRTAGLIDLDVELSFAFARQWRIELAKEEIEIAVTLYRILESISNRKQQHRRLLAAEDSAFRAHGPISYHLLPGADPAAMAEAMAAAAIKWAARLVDLYHPLSYEKEFDAIMKPAGQ